jgi:predicted glycosyltransferase
LRVMIEIGHPAQVHLFKNLAWKLQERGHVVRVAASKKEISIDLIKGYGFDYDVLYDNRHGGLFSKFGMLMGGEMAMLKAARRFKPDIFISAASEISGPVSRVFRKPHIGVSDTEHAGMTNSISSPFTDVVLTPSSYKKAIGRRQIRFEGCKELAYLHPNVFKPDPTVLEELGLSEDDDIFLVRFSSFNATHDVNSENFNRKHVPLLIDRLEKAGKVIITSERALEPGLKKYQRDLNLLKYHDLLYYSKLYVGEGSTSANEAAVLGVPALHFERMTVGGRVSDVTPYIGVIDELQNKYGLVYTFHDEDMLLAKLDEILSDVKGAKRGWERKRARFLRDKIDLTSFMLWVVENYPASLDEIKRSPGLQMKFQ